MKKITLGVVITLILLLFIPLINGNQANSAGESISGRVWYDIDGNGIQEQAEINYPLEWGTISDFNTDHEFTLHDATTDAVIATVQSDENGEYEFTGIVPGTYYVAHDSISVATPFSSTIFNAGSDDTVDSDFQATPHQTDDITVNLNDTISNVDIGLFPTGFGCVGGWGEITGTLFDDVNNNGVQDTGEMGLPGVTMRKYDDENNLVETIQTDTNGAYAFTQTSTANMYRVEIENITPFSNINSTITYLPVLGTATYDLNIDENGVTQYFPINACSSAEVLSGVNYSPEVNFDTTPVSLNDTLSSDSNFLPENNYGPYEYEISNTGLGDITELDITLQGDNVSEFTVDSSECINALPIQPGQSCTVMLYFNPASAGAKNVSLVVRSNDLNNPTLVKDISADVMEPLTLIDTSSNAPLNILIGLSTLAIATLPFIYSSKIKKTT